MDVLDRADLPFPHSLPEFQRLFPDDAACAAYLEKARLEWIVDFGWEMSEANAALYEAPFGHVNEPDIVTQWKPNFLAIHSIEHPTALQREEKCITPCELY